LNGVKCDSRSFTDRPIDRPENLRAYLIRHKLLPSLSKVATQTTPMIWMKNEPPNSPRTRIYRTTPSGYVQ
jgi:hypothetical protein